MIILPTSIQQAKETLRLPVDGVVFENPSFPIEQTLEAQVLFIELYVFNLLNGRLYFAACDRNIEFIDPYTNTTVTYTAFPIEREVRKATVDNKLDSCGLKISNYDDSFTLAIFQGFDLRGRIVDVIQIAWNCYANEPVPNEYAIVGQWEMDSPVLNEKEATFKVDLKPRLQNINCGRTAMLSCNAEFGDSETCGANKDLQSTIVTSVVDSNEFYIGVTKADSYWRYGLITIGNEMKRIKSSTGNKITTEYPFVNTPTVGATVTIQRYCNKMFSTCRDMFGNSHNYSGIPSLPSEYRILT